MQDISLTESAMSTDDVLPTSAFLDKSGTATNTNHQVQLESKAVEPSGLRCEDWAIIIDLVQRLGLD